MVARHPESFAMMKVLLIALCLIPCLALGQPALLVNAIPTAGEFFSHTTVHAPVSDLKNADAKEVEAGLTAAIAGAIPFAEKNGITYICLLSAAGDDALEFQVGSAQEKLKLRAKNASFKVVFYRGGETLKNAFSYSTDKPDSDAKRVQITMKKVAVPHGWTTADWVYFNLPRIQATASKAGATQVFLAATGKGVTESVVIPGVKEPLVTFSEETVVSFAWYPRTDPSAKSVHHRARDLIERQTALQQGSSSNSLLALR